MYVYTCIFLTGLPSSVGDLKTNSSDSSITISWTAPFSLDVTIWYSVLIYNVTDEDHPTVVPCIDCTNITVTHYTFTPNYLSPCHKFNFTVTTNSGTRQGDRSENVTGREFVIQIWNSISTFFSKLLHVSPFQNSWPHYYLLRFL